MLFSSLYYNFIYILKKKENSNEHITKHNLSITASGDYDDTSFMDYNTIINGLNDGKHFKFH